MIWYAVFSPKQERHWWARKYGHVSLLGFENTTWTHLDLNRNGVQCHTFYAHDEVIDRLSFLMHYNAVLKFGPAHSKSHFFQPMTCVAFVKHTLGIRSCALRPDGLYRSLVHDYNAEIVNENAEHAGNAGAKARPDRG